MKPGIIKTEGFPPTVGEDGSRTYSIQFDTINKWWFEPNEEIKDYIANSIKENFGDDLDIEYDFKLVVKRT